MQPFDTGSLLAENFVHSLKCCLQIQHLMLVFVFRLAHVMVLGEQHHMSA